MRTALLLIAILALAGCMTRPVPETSSSPSSSPPAWTPPATQSVRFACASGLQDTVCPVDPGARPAAHAPRVAFDPTHTGTAAILYVGIQDAAAPVEGYQLRLLVTTDGGTTWKDRPGPALNPLPAGGAANPFRDLQTIFSPDGRLEAVAAPSYSSISATYWSESRDLGQSWSEAVQIPGVYSPGPLFASATHLWLSGVADDLDYTIAALPWNGTTWHVGLKSRMPDERCRDFGDIAMVSGKVVAACAVSDFRPGTVSYSTTSAIALVEIVPENMTYHEVGRMEEDVCFNPMSLVPLPDGRLFVQVQCERDVGKPILAFTMLAWLVDLDKGNWSVVKGPLGGTPAFDASDGVFWTTSAGDGQGLLHSLCWCIFKDDLQNVRHESTLYSAWNPANDTVVYSARLTDRVWVGDDPAGVSPLPRVYFTSAYVLARDGYM
ncbi:MAG: glycoside hydrolase, partial [Halobacteriales archaeon]|nr:glycoside hydrolase [Halobacteriales archaeon]